ncbi:glycosyltransferase [Vibrio coralliilyticus]|uniref:CgeB family protein n=1 Tax=Vibrio coralliilyticus TaxID=190893 RepID=UPI0039175E1E
MKLLVVSDRCENKSNTDYLVNAFTRNYDAKVIWTKSNQEKVSFFDRVLNKLNIERDKYDINKRLLAEVTSVCYDAIIIFKGNRIWPDTLKKIKKIRPNTKLVSWSGDNMSKWHNKSIFYHFGINSYDYVFSVNIPSYRAVEKFCNKPVYYFDKRADRFFHRPSPTEYRSYKYEVLFIGSYEHERLLTLLSLANEGIEVDIFGNMWNRCNIPLPKELRVHYRELIGNEYAEALSSAKVSLGFLRKINDDTQTSRSFEIPACGGFMLMERTDEHMRLFEEGVEAEFFANDEELLAKLHYYLDNNEVRERVARAGLKKVCDKGYYFDDLSKEMLDILE